MSTGCQQKNTNKKVANKDTSLSIQEYLEQALDDEIFERNKFYQNESINSLRVEK